MKFSQFVFILVLLVSFNPVAFGSDVPIQPNFSIPQLVLRVGQRYPLEGILPEKIEVQPEGIAKIDQNANGFELIGIRPGQTTLKLQQDGKKIEIKLLVKSEENNSSGAEATSKATFPKGIKTSTVAGKTLIEGTVFSRSLYQRILLFEKNNPSNLLLRIKAAPFLRESLCEQAENELKTHGFTNAIVVCGKNKFYLKGFVDSPEQVEQALELASSVIPNIKNEIPTPIRIDPTITFRVFMIELTKNAHEDLGLSWPTSTAAFVLSPFQAAQKFLLNPSWSTILVHLKKTGQAKVLAEPILAVKSGSSAELTAGGEIPIRTTGKYENKVTWKNYGLKIKIQVSGIAGKSIRTSIETESSQLDEASSIDGIPGIKNNKMQTEIDAKADSPVLLTGLFQSTESTGIDSLPGLGSIPILGELFKSRSFKNRESELLVVLLPSFGAIERPLPLKTRSEFN